MRTLDSNYSDWKIGDRVVWEVDPYTPLPLEIIGIDRENGIIYYKTTNGDKNQIKREYLMRVTETERDKTIMTDLEKLITELLEIPSIDLEGDENKINVRYATREYNQPFIVLEDWGDIIYLHPSQALALLDWLKDQRGNLEELQEVLRLEQIKEEATKEQREAERINALKVKHSDAVVAWQESGCAGPCPSFEEIANPNVEFIMKFPALEMLRKRQIDAIPATDYPLQPTETPLYDAMLAGYQQPPRFRPPVLAETEELGKAVKNNDQFIFMGNPGDTLQDIEKLRESVKADEDNEDAYFATGFLLDVRQEG